MAATAYASLVSLLNTMDHINIHPLLSTCFNKYRHKSLRKKVNFFLDFVENYSDPDNAEAEDLFSQIADVFRMAEDIIEVEAAERVRDGSTQQSRSFLADLHKTLEEMNIIKQKVIKFKGETAFITRQATSSMIPPSSSDSPATSTTTTMVGFDGYLEQLLDQLTGYPYDRRIILPIVGMGGIGKTTLTKNTYENLLIKNHFYVRAWVTVSQEFNPSKVLSQALSCLGGSTSEMNRNDDQLGEELYQILCGQKYLIILDDVWSVNVWEKIMFYFPENNNGSRIIITTRQVEVVEYFGSSSLALGFLDDKNSWELFCEKTFARQGCPHELEEVGKRIVDKCKGLPLAIVVIAGLLAKSFRTPDYWEEIAKDKSLIMDLGEGNEPLRILYLSYKHLSVYLRSCFLYLGSFPEDYEIDVSELIQLWIAEGFIKPNKNQSVEEVAQSYLEELIRRNLLLVSQLEQNKKMSSCYTHDLVRDLCISIAKKEKIFSVKRDIDGFICDETTTRCFKYTSLARPLVVETALSKSRLLRVYSSLFRMDSSGFPFQQCNLRFLRQHIFERTYEIPSSISLLWSLQTLILTGSSTIVAPNEIWMMTQLRHIDAHSLSLPDPPSRGDVLVFQNLHTLKSVRNLNFTQEVCKRIPNIKDLHIIYDLRDGSRSYNLQNVGFLNKLESLHYYCEVPSYAHDDSLQKLKFPSSLKELTLDDYNFAWSDMAMISLLPHLEILELKGDVEVQGVWICVEQKFLCLKHLRVHIFPYLFHWIADESSFPVLETLTLEFLFNLEEIPLGIGDIPTLKLITMLCCSESATISAIKILEEQESLGNQNLQLILDSTFKTEAEMWKEKIQELGFTCQNLHIINTHDSNLEESFTTSSTNSDAGVMSRLSTIQFPDILAFTRMVWRYFLGYFARD